MTLKTNQLRDAIKIAIAVGTIAGTGTAFAQEAAAPQEREATTLDRIEVTGSRIKRADIETSQPVFSLSRDEIQAQGLTSVGDVIQNITANGSTLNTTMNNGGNGETRVSLRNLGSNRTLVLVNGRRWVGGTGLGGAVDLNTIPTAAVERIEVLKDGASVIYGSDAISGVVNVILRQNFDGAEANAYIGQFDKGDGTRQAYDFTVGSSGDRWNAMLGVGYVQEEPVMAGDREISSVPVFRTGNLIGSTTTPNGRFAVCNGANFDPIFGTCSGQTQPNGAGGQFTYSGYDPSLTPQQNAENYRAFFSDPNAEPYNFAPDNYLLTPQERISLFASGALDITDNIRFKVTTTFNERKSEQLLASMPIVLGTGPGASPNARAIVIDEDSIYNPWGDWSDGNVFNNDNNTIVSRIQRRANETGLRSFNQNVDTWAFHGGFEGDFEVGERFFSWDAGYFYGKNEQNDTTHGLFNLTALGQGLGPSFIDSDGVAKCGTPDNPATPVNERSVILGCVPVNLLGGLGSMTPEMLDYATFVAHDAFGYTQKTYYANISGELFDLPAGAFAFAAGYEHRTESGYDQPDSIIATGNSTGNNRRPTAGGFSLDEFFLELSIPILADVPGAKLLDVSIASRYSDYDTFGDTTNSKFGLRWKPFDDLLVRGNWTEGFRAPSVGELFTGLSDSFPQLLDPCSTGPNGNRYAQLSPEGQANCHAQGVPVGGYNQGNAQIRISAGGNEDLRPELAETTTFGFVYSPGFVEGLDISLDWWKIELEDAITTRSGSYLAGQCIRVSLTDPECQQAQIVRGSDGAIVNLVARPYNLSATDVEGYDMTVSYRLPETRFGRFNFTWDTTYMSLFENDNDGDNLVGEYFDRSNNWRIRSNLATRWEMGDFGATWNVRYYSRQEEDCPFYYNDYGFGQLCNDPVYADESTGELAFDEEGNALSQQKMGGTTYHDLSAYWNAPWNAKITLGVNNAFAKDPPVSFTTFANSFDPQYEIPGRFYYMRYTQKF